MNIPVPPWTLAMQSLWDSAMLIERTRGAYGVGFPVEGTTFRPPTAGTMLHTILFVATSPQDEVAAHLAAVRKDMEAWKARVRASGSGKRALSVVRDIDLSKLEFEL